MILNVESVHEIQDALVHVSVSEYSIYADSWQEQVCMYATILSLLKCVVSILSLLMCVTAACTYMDRFMFIRYYSH